MVLLAVHIEVKLERRVNVQRYSHVEVLLGHLQVPLDGAIDVEVKLLRHRQRNERSSDCLRLLTESIMISLGLN